MKVSSFEFGEEHRRALGIITYCGLSLSLVFLLLSFISFSCVKELRGDRNTIHKNLVACLFCAELLFLISYAFVTSQVLCRVASVVLHYSFLASFTWALLEGVHLYFMLVRVFSTSRPLAPYYYIIAYSVPLIITATTLGVSGGKYNWRGHGSINTHCWLSVDHGFIWSFVGPVAVILTVNLGMLSTALVIMCRHLKASAKLRSTEVSRRHQLRRYLQGAWVLVVLLGLTWLSGFFYMQEEEASATVFAYLFTLLNCLQGSFIFLCYCLGNAKMCILKKTSFSEGPLSSCDSRGSVSTQLSTVVGQRVPTRELVQLARHLVPSNQAMYAIPGPPTI